MEKEFLTNNLMQSTNDTKRQIVEDKMSALIDPIQHHLEQIALEKRIVPAETQNELMLQRACRRGTNVKKAVALLVTAAVGYVHTSQVEFFHLEQNTATARELLPKASNARAARNPARDRANMILWHKSEREMRPSEAKLKKLEIEHRDQLEEPEQQQKKGESEASTGWLSSLPSCIIN